MIIAHLSDPHVVEWAHLSPRRFLNKRMTGWVNFRFRRNKVHRLEVLEAILDDIEAHEVDHVAVTGDLSSLAFGQELRRFVGLLEARGLGSDRVSIIPGNHDAYTAGAWRRGVFVRDVGAYSTSDVHGGATVFPFVRLRGDVAFVGLSSAVPRPAFFANGLVGAAQLARFEELLRRPEVEERLPLVLVHHPLIPYRKAAKEIQAGLLDRDRVVETFRRGLGGRDAVVLCGHWHTRSIKKLELPGTVWHVQAPSASHFGGEPDRAGGYNLLHVEQDGSRRPFLKEILAKAFDPSTGVVRTVNRWVPA